MTLVLAFLASPTIYWNFERIALQLPPFYGIKDMKYVTQKDRKHTLLLATNVPSSKKSGWRQIRSAGRCAGHCATRSKSAYFLSDFARTPGLESLGVKNKNTPEAIRNSNEPSRPQSRQELVSWKQLLLRSVENTNLKNSKLQYTQEHEKSQTEHHSIPFKGCSQGPNSCTYSDWGF